MLYLLYGTDEVIINSEIKKIIASNQIDNLNINYYDLETDSLNNIIEDVTTVSLFSGKKTIIVKNAYIFTDTIKKGLIDQDTKVLEKYFNNIIDDVIVIFVCANDKISERKKIAKLIKEKGTVKNINNIDYRSYVKELLNGYKIDNDNINLIIALVGNDKSILEQELEKLRTYKIDDKIITTEDIKNVITEVIDIDIFRFIDNIVNDNKKQALTTYYELMKQNEEPIKIIIMLANQFRLLYQTKVLSKEGYSEFDIASNLKVHPYRIKLALKNGKKFTNDMLIKYLKKLHELDINIKSGVADKDMALELFILENKI